MFKNDKELEDFIRKIFPFVVVLSYKDYFISRDMDLEDRKKFIQEKLNDYYRKNKSIEKKISIDSMCSESITIW